MAALINLVQRVLKRANLRLVQNRRYEELREAARIGDSLAVLGALPADQLPRLLQLSQRSRSQLGQELFVLSHLGFKREGFFVEFGATDGISLSNTYLLETEFGWKGILAEPARCWHERLMRNRRASIEVDCVWKSSGSTLAFRESSYAELSTIDSYRRADQHGKSRRFGRSYEVSTISLDDMLEKHTSPPEIDYLSIDTEGSELEILQGVDFSRHTFRVISCEHNFTPAREEIRRLLESNGYERRLEQVSRVDDWYVKA